MLHSAVCEVHVVKCFVKYVMFYDGALHSNVLLKSLKMHNENEHCVLFKKLC